MPSSILLRVSRIPLLAGAVVLSVACAGRTPVPVTAAAPVLSAQAPVAATPAPSVFDLPDFWYSQHVGAAKLASLTGGLLVVGFVDTDCPESCAATLASMRKVERETDIDVHFVLVARPGNAGSPGALAEFVKARHLAANRYTLISGSNEAVRKLVATLDTRNSGLSPASIEESSLLSVLDYNGIVVQQRGYGSVAPIIEALTLLSNIR